MARRKTHTTKADYTRLYDNPEALFPGVQTRIRMADAYSGPEIHLRTADGLHIRIRASNGKAGLGVQIERVAGSTALTVTGNAFGTCECLLQVDADNVSICQYRADDKAQAFKRWYGSDLEGKEGNPYPYSDGEKEGE